MSSYETTGWPEQRAYLQVIGHNDPVTSVAFSHDSKLLASSFDKTAQIMHSHLGLCIHVLEGHSAAINSVTFSHDSKYLASGALDGTICIWSTDVGECIKCLEGHKSSVNSVVFSRDSKLLASGSLEGTIRIWRADLGSCIQVLEGNEEAVISVAFSHKLDLLGSGSSDGTIRIWGFDSRECTQASTTSSKSAAPTFQLLHTYTPSLQSLSATRHASLLRRPIPQENGSMFINRSNWVAISIAFSSDLEHAAIASRTAILQVRHFGSRRQSANNLHYKVHYKANAILKSVAFSPDSQHIASGRSGGTISIWHSESGDCVQDLGVHDNVVGSVAFSHDSQLLASGSNDRTIRTWYVGNSRDNNVTRFVRPYRMVSRSDFEKNPGFDISEDSCWIMWRERRLLWLPVEIRPVHKDLHRSAAIHPNIDDRYVRKTNKYWDDLTGAKIEGIDFVPREVEQLFQRDI